MGASAELKLGAVRAPIPTFPRQGKASEGTEQLPNSWKAGLQPLVYPRLQLACGSPVYAVRIAQTL